MQIGHLKSYNFDQKHFSETGSAAVILFLWHDSLIRA